MLTPITHLPVSPILVRFRLYLRLATERHDEPEVELHSHPLTPGMIAAFRQLSRDMGEVGCEPN